MMNEREELLKDLELLVMQKGVNSVQVEFAHLRQEANNFESYSIEELNGLKNSFISVVGSLEFKEIINLELNRLDENLDSALHRHHFCRKMPEPASSLEESELQEIVNNLPKKLSFIEKSKSWVLLNLMLITAKFLLCLAKIFVKKPIKELASKIKKSVFLFEPEDLPEHVGVAYVKKIKELTAMLHANNQVGLIKKVDVYSEPDLVACDLQNAPLSEKDFKEAIPEESAYTVYVPEENDFVKLTTTDSSVKDISSAYEAVILNKKKKPVKKVVIKPFTKKNKNKKSGKNK